MKTSRIRSPAYMRHVRGKPCLVCGNRAEAHHLTFAEPRAMGTKNGDNWCVPLCHAHHMKLHDSPMPERTWWALHGIEPLIWAKNNWNEWEKDHASDTPSAATG